MSKVTQTRGDPGASRELDMYLFGDLMRNPENTVHKSLE